MADFTGFYLGGVHSSTYGILRVSDGDRYKEGLIPEFEDKDIELSGGSGHIYGGKKYKKTPFEVKIAFDHLTEKQFREMRSWLDSDGLQSFRFDERPYKTYWVKISSRPELEYVCFMEDKEDGLIGEKERIYKGEGELKFTAYDPFGYCVNEQVKVKNGGLEEDSTAINWQDLASYNVLNLKDDNVTEWAEVSGLKTNFGSTPYDIPDGKEVSGQWQYYIDLYNPGDFDTDFQLSFVVSNGGYDAEGKNVNIYIYPEKYEEPGEDSLSFVFNLISFDKGSIIFLDTKKHALSIRTAEKVILRYDLVESMNWLKIPKGEWKMKIVTAADPKKFCPQFIKYNYKYY